MSASVVHLDEQQFREILARLDRIEKVLKADAPEGPTCARCGDEDELEDRGGVVKCSTCWAAE